MSCIRLSICESHDCERRDVDLVKGVKFEIIFPVGKVDAGKFFTVNQVRFCCACRHVAGA
jgi:hypothetical protein